MNGHSALELILCWLDCMLLQLASLRVAGGSRLSVCRAAPLHTVRVPMRGGQYAFALAARKSHDSRVTANAASTKCIKLWADRWDQPPTD